MTTPVVRENLPNVVCPSCGESMRREYDGVRNPPMPQIFWFCINSQCDEGKLNKIYSGG